jgi:ABC-type nickel/cobalt efflux system permease component RcnA
MWNNELIASITLGATATVPIVVAMTQMIKVTGWIHEKYMPFVSILSGLLFGLAGSGLYSGIKASTNAFRAEKNKYKVNTDHKKNHKR